MKNPSPRSFLMLGAAVAGGLPRFAPSPPGPLRGKIRPSFLIILLYRTCRNRLRSMIKVEAEA